MKSERMKQAWRGWVQVQMSNAESLSLEQIRQFLSSSQAIEFSGCGIGQKYAYEVRGPSLHRIGDGIQRLRRQEIVLIEEADVLLFGQRTRPIRSATDS